MEEKYYEILRHYVNPNDCATVVKQLLSLDDVNQQSELLVAFKNHWNENNDICSEEISKDDLSDFIVTYND